jgi:HAD superfamily hydrolase (TIGR01549 family)
VIKAILFDIDGVLLDSFDANLQFFTNLFNKAGYTPPTREEYKSMFFLTMLDVIKIVCKGQPESEIERVRQIGVNRDELYPLELVKMPEGTIETVKLLHKGYPLGLVTSRIREGIYSIPQLAVLEKYMRVTVAFEDVKEHKPHPEPLLLAASKLGLEPENVVYVGDAETDFKAAKAAGMKIIMYKNRTIEGADGYIDSLDELPNLL